MSQEDSELNNNREQAKKFIPRLQELLREQLYSGDDGADEFVSWVAMVLDMYMMHECKLAASPIRKIL